MVPFKTAGAEVGAPDEAGVAPAGAAPGALVGAGGAVVGVAAPPPHAAAISDAAPAAIPASTCRRVIRFDVSALSVFSIATSFCGAPYSVTPLNCLRPRHGMNWALCLGRDTSIWRTATRNAA